MGTDLWRNLPCKEHKPPVRAGRLARPVSNVHAGKLKAVTHIGFASRSGETARWQPALSGGDIEGHAVVIPRRLTWPSWVLASRGVSIFTAKNTMNISRVAFVSYLLLDVFLLFGFVKPAFAAQEEISGGIHEMMSPEEFKAAGLNKLSPEELQKLDAWLQGYRQVAEKKATARAERTKLDVLVSHVDGSFNGLTGRTVIRLEDGTVWKQANAEDRFRPRITDHPAAAVLHGIFGYKMRIEGTPEFYVDPVRNP
jgi:hypothetical protein